ncbi:hypothetical protein M409DRAFT_61918 [Zasmidium cellare ATCC 36951]|uniref:C4-dicarboxylate transporter/malic acid transport protein n=1 Tax=Zasmidium cellare ATCC 36951 TaxID=1080233 RepID=A0A6A6D363_ZASCE|nr:uncharacterized protein M409DRAFT_61918 [Zasmidium cellare ATCC 36951]KAF2173553.1 hypothetical protein M409DRAFT_61918 [Zasmidium cellare ATCC 36951]
MSSKDSSSALEEGINGTGTTHHDDSKKADEEEEAKPQRLPFPQWLVEHMSWSWFTCPQSTGGIAVVLSECPKQFHGLETIGKIIFIFNLVVFVTFTAFMLIRWVKDPRKVRECFTKAPECYFFGSFWLSFATTILNTQRYGIPYCGPWLIVTVRVLFWFYVANSFLTTNLHIVWIAKHTPFKALEFQPPMFILVLNAMLTGTVAAAVSETQPPRQRVPIMVAGVAYQGLGWIVCMIFLTLLMANLLENGWPAPNLRPGLFIMSGTSGFTITALIGIARAAPKNYGYFATHPSAPEVLLIVATWVGVFMWVFTFWVFGLAFWINVAELLVRREDGKGWRVNVAFTNVAWAMIFPNVGWTLSTIYLGQELESEGVIWVSVAMVILLVAFWLLDLALMAKTFCLSVFKDSRIKMG